MYKLKFPSLSRQILHIDADSFFATVEQALDPSLKNKAIIVSHSSDSNKGIVSAASYEAKKFGLYSGMPLFKAKKLCPQAKIVKGHFKEYKKFSKRMYQIFCSFTDMVEMSSIDEAYLDITGLNKVYNKSYGEIAKMILMEVNSQLNISVSCGLAANKLIAKVASSINKPHKLTIVPHGKEKEFLEELELSAIPGVGPKTYELLNRFNLHRGKDLSSMTAGEIIEEYGIGMISIWKKACGISNSQVIPHSSLPKSISKERTFFHSQLFNQNHIDILSDLCDLVLVKLRTYEMKAKSIGIKIRYKRDDNKMGKIFLDKSFQIDLGFHSDNSELIFQYIKNLFLEKVDKKREIRLLGFFTGNLLKNYNLSLFSEKALIDSINERKQNEEENQNSLIKIRNLV